MIEDHATFDTFGLITVSPSRITVSATTVFGSQQLTRSIVRDLENPLDDVLQGEQIASTFGANISSRKIRLVSHPIGSLKSGKEVSELPVVSSVVSEALKLLRQDSAKK